MIVTCPQCASGYVLPESLIGPGGARVRCPGCAHEFVVPPPAGPGRPGEPYDPPGDPGPAAPGEPPPEPERNPEIPAGPSTEPAQGDPPYGTRGAERVAHEVLGELAERTGTRIAEAASRGLLFSEYGPALIDAWDEYVRRLGPGAPSGAFREALRERWGIDLSAALQRDPG